MHGSIPKTIDIGSRRNRSLSGFAVAPQLEVRA